MTEFYYNKKWALLTAIILILGGLLISLANHSSSAMKESPFDFGIYFLYVAPALLILSFAPVIVCSIITKIKERKSQK
jgi:hypothetical protein